jgi:gamma-glutamyl:cysteine ligase YbdK (ATP-grasp superfamily)
MPDQPTSVERSGAFVALLQALCATALELPQPERDPGSRALYQQNRWAAARFGLAADLIDPTASRADRATELAHELLGLVAESARALGSADLLATLDPERCEGERQLEIGRSDGLDAATRDIVERSLSSA